MTRLRSPLVAVMAACLSYALLQSLALPTLPTMERRFDVGTGATVWIVLAFVLTSCSASPILGGLGDRVGRRRMLEVSLVAFVVGSLVSGFAGSISMVIVGRALQGLGGAVFPLAFSVIGHELPARRVGVALGLVSSSFSVGGVVGMPLGGVIMEGLSWRWCYFVPAGLACCALVLVRMSIGQGETDRRHRVDLLGGALLALWLTLLLLGMTAGGRAGWWSVPTVSLLVGAGIVLVTWMLVELRARAPLIDVRLLARAPVPMASFAAFAMGWVQIGVIGLLPIHLGAAAGLDLTPTQTGLLFVPGFVVAMIAAPLGGALGARRGYRRLLVVGLASAGSALVLPALVDTPWAFGVFIGFAMVGVTLAFSALPGLLVTALPSEVAGGVTGMNTTFRNVGGAIGAQVGATLIGGGGDFAGYLWVSAVLLGLTLAIAAVLPSCDGQRATSLIQLNN
ncbi:MAG: MFS transporter [Aeromicrobium sp.]